MFDEIVLRINLGCKILAGHLVVGRLGQDQAESIVAISQTLDKLVVHDSPSPSGRTTSSKLANNDDDTTTTTTTIGPLVDESSISPTISQSVYYIAIKDVIKTVSVKSFKVSSFSPEASNRRIVDESLDISANEMPASKSKFTAESISPKMQASRNKNSYKDLLLIGCSNSVLIYDVIKQSNLLNINTPTSIIAITRDPIARASDTRVAPDSTRISGLTNQLTVCGGSQKVYVLKFESRLDGRSIDAELSSERSTGDTIICLEQGSLNGMDLVLTGSIEQKIRLYQMDAFDHNIQTCKLTIEESSQINCLCSINTESISRHQVIGTTTVSTAHPVEFVSQSKSLPSVTGQAAVLAPEQGSEQMNYFAYGLENGFIGVYRLFHTTTDLESSRSLSTERLWRHKCKYTPLTIMMYDINGDGLDELVVGFKNSRLEARSPFTGQLLAATRCFKPDRLAGLNVIDYYQDGRLILLACSTSGNMIGFKPRLSRPRIPLQGYSLPATSQHQLRSLDVEIDEWASSAFTTGHAAVNAGGGVSLSATSATSTVTNLKTIEEEQQQDQRNATSDVFMKETTTVPADLHIESQSDDTKPTKCDARQSLDLLQRINALQTEQMELERRACHIYHMNVYQASKFYPSDVNIAHKWDFDSPTVYLRLTIVISTNVEDVTLIKLEDESKNFLTSGYLLVNPANKDGTCEFSRKNGKAYVVVVPLRSVKPIETKLELKVFCQSYRRRDSQNSKMIKLARVYSKAIDVPKFSMFAFAPTEITPTKGGGKSSDVAAVANNKNSIRMTFQLNDSAKLFQVLEWLNESFLCFQFGNLIKNHSSQAAESASSNPHHLVESSMNHIIRHPKLMMDDTENFTINLLDIRYTLEKIQVANLKETQGGDLGGSGVSVVQQPTETLTTFKVTTMPDDEYKVLTKFGSTLRIAHSNGALTFECESSDLAVDLVQSLVIDRLHLEPSSDKLQQGKFVADVKPVLDELDTVTKNSRQLEESEKRIQTELYESADYTRNLMQQFAIANELNEFTTAKELLSELFMMLNGAQNAARAHCLNNRSRSEFSKRVSKLEEKISFLSGGHFASRRSYH